MVDLATEYGNAPVEMSAIAKRQDLSRKYLHALLSALKTAGLTKSVRGAKGGYMLSRAPEKIIVSEICEALEGRLSIVKCVTEPDFCSRMESCPTVGLWQKLNAALEDVLKNTTLADLAEGQSPGNVGACSHAKR
jgi:Rrf2 family protein